MRAKPVIGLTVAAAFLAGLGVAESGWLQSGVASFAYAVESGEARAAEAQASGAGNFQEPFELAAKAIEPSVVSITSSHTVRAPQLPEIPQWPFGDFFGDNPQGQEFFHRFFNQPGGPGPGVQAPRNLHQMALGSGVIISKDGYILTNAHVVRDADELTVQLSDDRKFTKVHVVGVDPKTDVAVIKIEATDLVPAQLGNSDDLQVGQWVMAAGSPFGLRQTVSAGIISAKGRDNVGVEDYEDFLQTDAAINPGNSGGPLINLQGQVIGINTAIASRSGGFQGIGFAIPVNMARQVMDELMKNGKVTRAYLGVMIQDLTPELASSFNYKGDHGILISQATKDGPAAKAGLQAGDIITSLDGRTVGGMRDFRVQIAESAPGRKVNLEVWHDGKTRDVTVALGVLPEAVAEMAGGVPTQINVHDLGLELVDPTPENRQHYNLATGVAGAVVASVEDGSPAQTAGLKPGDVIDEVNNHPIHDATQAEQSLGEQNVKHGVRLHVLRGGEGLYVFLQLGGE